jgi:hypothetical protein
MTVEARYVPVMHSLCRLIGSGLILLQKSVAGFFGQ